MTRVAAAHMRNKRKREPDKERRKIQRQENGKEGEGGDGREGVRGEVLRGNGYWKKFLRATPAAARHTKHRTAGARSLSWPIRRNASWLALRGWMERR